MWTNIPLTKKLQDSTLQSEYHILHQEYAQAALSSKVVSNSHVVRILKATIE